MHYTKHTLKNGLRYVLVPRDDTQAFTLLVLFRVGSRYETKGLYGAAHYIEHLMFKGTKKRPTSQHISKELDSVGAEYNAFTAKNHTGYYIKTDGAHSEMACDILSDMVWNSLFDAKEMEKEKSVIVEEVKMYAENPIMRIDEMFEEEVYKGNQLARIISGEKEDVLGYKRKEVLEFRDQYYRPNNMMVIAVGNIGGNMAGSIEKYFGSIAPSKLQPKLFKKFSSIQKHPQIRIEKKDLGQVQMMLGFPAFGIFDSRQYAAKLLGIILGGNMSSRLFAVVREKHALAYSIGAGLDMAEDTGNFTVSAGLDQARIHSALKLIMKELKKVKENLISPRELYQAKEFIKGKTILALEDSSAIADYYGKQELFKKKILTPDEIFALYNRVTREDIQKVARDIFLPQKLNLALIGPFENTKEFSGLEKMI